MHCNLYSTYRAENMTYSNLSFLMRVGQKGVELTVLREIITSRK